MKKTTQKGLKNRGWSAFLALCSSISDPKELEEFFALFLTLKEKNALAGRYFVIKALREGKLTQREIAKHYHVSIASITRGSNALKIIPPFLKTLLEEESL